MENLSIFLYVPEYVQPMIMEFHFDLGLVLLSILVSVLASYTALNLASSLWDARNQRSRLFWLIGGSLAMGVGIWSMHFIGMLAFSMPGMIMAYDRPLMALSIIVAIAASGLALHVVSDPKRVKPAYVYSGMAMGAAIAGMHYIGMASMRMEARIEWNYFLVLVSVMIAVVASIAALYISFYLRGETKKRSHLRVAGALGMGFAIAGMHYTGMFAAQFIHDPSALDGPISSHGLIASGNLTTLVTFATVVMLATALSGSFFDQALRRRIHQAQESDRLFQKANKAVLDLEEERELRERFVSSLTHDLRTPITAAQLSAQMMARVIHDPERLLQLSAKVLENLKRADDMIRDLLDAQRISAEQELPLNVAETDLADLAIQTIDDLRTIHGDRFQLQLPNSVKGTWDKKYLKRVIENLCSNAVKYGRAHGTVNVTLTCDNHYAYFSVQNEGIPLSQSEMGSLFQLFHRAKAATLSGTQGWGIGLTLVKGVVESHGGKISVSSDAKNGTHFTVTLPLKIVS